jgi:hypothetical protein
MNSNVRFFSYYYYFANTTQPLMAEEVRLR